jgi:hypothetical protein
VLLQHSGTFADSGFAHTVNTKESYDEYGAWASARSEESWFGHSNFLFFHLSNDIQSPPASLRIRVCQPGISRAFSALAV